MCLSPYPIELATIYCRQLAKHFDATGSITEYPEKEDQDHFFSTKYLFQPFKGHMFGVLVCRPTRQTDLPLSSLNDDGCIILKAFSGQFFGTWVVPGYVFPCFDVDDWNTEVLNSDSKIKEAKGTEQKKLSAILLKKIYNLYKFHCINGKVNTFSDFYSLMPPLKCNKDNTKNGEYSLPPTGTGDCCAPKLLNYAFMHGLKPISLAEFYYGSPNKSNTKQHLEFYPPCQEKCSLVLPEMLGIEILYYDESIVVVNKPAGMLSVPGRTEDKKDCVVSRVRHLFPDCIPQPSVHRLDMETSGLLVMALTKEAHRKLSIQFQERKTNKEYIALIRGSLFCSKGESAKKAVAEFQNKKKSLSEHIELRFRLDINNRPYQIYDEENGKLGITDWVRIGEEKLESETVTRIKFIPKTGRTHQLRLHSAHIKGLGSSIVGDTLYGTRSDNENRMMLHAEYLSFFHPATGKQMDFHSKCPF
jgi:tRNA pseudouridine32 synthase/23S rRNA pseudouridine746 synthase